MFFDTGIHMVDALVWLFGDLSAIEYADDSYGGVEANAELRGTFVVAGRTVPARLFLQLDGPRQNRIRVRGAPALQSPHREPDAVIVRQVVGGAPLEMHVHRGGLGSCAGD